MNDVFVRAKTQFEGHSAVSIFCWANTILSLRYERLPSRDSTL